MATGADADQIIDEARRRTVSRRQLATSSLFDDVSPELDQLDEAALAEAMEDDPDEALSLMAEMVAATDEGLRAHAKRIASRLFVDLVPTGAADTRGIGRIVTTPYRPDGGDLDIDRSVDGLVAARSERRAVIADDLMIRSWARPTTAFCLLVDRSGSMHGLALATAALAAAAMAVRSTHDGEHDHAVLSFARDVVAVKAMWETRSPDDIIERALALRGHGTTDLAGALRASAAQLATSSAGRRVTVLLSDCRATVPGDVVGAARSLDELVIVAPEGESDDAVALAEVVGARWTTVAGPSGVPAALSAVLGR